MTTPAFSEQAPAVAITGPTASGKTSLAVSLACDMDGEIVSADSRQVYRGMDLGTGKDLADYAGVPYHMIDVADAGYRYNLYEYLRDARAAIADIRSRGRLPVVCGGTGLYLESLLSGVSMPEVPENPALRESLSRHTLQELTAILASMKQLHNVTDVDTPQRAIRAIEIQTYYRDHPDMAGGERGVEPLRALIIGVEIGRDERRARIAARLRTRLDSGMIQEVERLIASGIHPDNLIYYGLEYKYLTLYVTGRISRPDMEEQLLTAIRQFAKRQMTWFRGMERRGYTIHWLPFDMPPAEFCARVRSLMSQS